MRRFDAVNVNQNGGSDSSDLWPGWQNEPIAVRRVDEAFSNRPFATAPFQAIVCVIHATEHPSERHHLDESGKKCSAGWFFENLIPICGSENEAIEQSRRRR